MKALVVLILFVFSFAVTIPVANAQNTPAQQPPAKILKPKVYAADLIFAFQLLNTIELRGSEVDALLEVKNALKPYIEKIQKENLQLNAVVTFDISAPLAYNLLQFLERGKFTGSDAEKYKRFVEAMSEAAKAIESSTK
jgi:hypothetical protein